MLDISDVATAVSVYLWSSHTLPWTLSHAQNKKVEHKKKKNIKLFFFHVKDSCWFFSASTQNTLKNLEANFTLEYNAKFCGCAAIQASTVLIDSHRADEQTCFGLFTEKKQWKQQKKCVLLSNFLSCKINVMLNLNMVSVLQPSCINNSTRLQLKHTPGLMYKWALTGQRPKNLNVNSLESLRLAWPAFSPLFFRQIQNPSKIF